MIFGTFLRIVENIWYCRVVSKSLSLFSNILATVFECRVLV